MRKNIFTILCCLALTAMAVGCSDVENPAAPDTVLDKTMISFTIAGGNENVAITTPSAWTISTGAVDWVSVTPMSGTGNATVAVTVAPNVVTKARSVTLTITAENAPAVTVLILQNGTTVPEDAGTIEGDNINSCPVETVTLTIPQLAGAISYQWYMNGNAIAGATTTSYTVTQSGIYNVAGVNQVGVGEQSPNKVVTITECIPPDDAGTIQGADENVCPARTVTLTIADIAYAETYRWYRNGTLISGATTNTYVVAQSGTYTVAGFNPTAEGALSPEKEVTIVSCGDFDMEGAWYGSGWDFFGEEEVVWNDNITFATTHYDIDFYVSDSYGGAPTPAMRIMQDPSGDYYFETIATSIGNADASSLGLGTLPFYQQFGGYESRAEDGVIMLEGACPIIISGDGQSFSIPATIDVTLSGTDYTLIPCWGSKVIYQGTNYWWECIGEIVYSRTSPSPGMTITNFTIEQVDYSDIKPLKVVGKATHISKR